MANGHGGYRRPSNPAPVSGPGALSKRTDGRQPVSDLPNAKYGENAAYREAQQGAPMSQTPGQATPGGMGMMPDLSGIVPLGAPTQRPNEPLTAGLPGGPGAGPSAPAIPAPQMSAAQRQRLQSYLPVLTVLASMPDADPATKQYVRSLRADLG